MKTPYKEIPVYAVATILGRSREQVFTLIRQGRLHKGKKIKLGNHWFATVKQDRAYWKLMKKRGLLENNQQARVPSEFNPADPSPIQTVTPNEMLQNEYYGLFGNIVLKINSEYTHATLDKCRNAMNICLEAQKACDNDKQECCSRAAECKGKSAHVDEAANYIAHAKVACWRSEHACTRCTTILAAACILQLLLAAYYTLCQFNII